MTKLLSLFTGYTWSSPCACWLSHERFSNCWLWPIILASPFLCWQGYILIRLATMVILKIKFAKMSAISQDLMFFSFYSFEQILKKHDTIDLLFESPRVSLGLSNDASFVPCFFYWKAVWMEKNNYHQSRGYAIFETLCLTILISQSTDEI